MALLLFIILAFLLKDAAILLMAVWPVKTLAILGGCILMYAIERELKNDNKCEE